MRILSRQSIFEPSRAGAGHLFGYGIIYVNYLGKTQSIERISTFFGQPFLGKTKHLSLFHSLKAWHPALSNSHPTSTFPILGKEGFLVPPFCWGQSPPGVSLLGEGSIPNCEGYEPMTKIEVVWQSRKVMANAFLMESMDPQTVDPQQNWAFLAFPTKNWSSTLSHTP